MWSSPCARGGAGRSDAERVDYVTSIRRIARDSLPHRPALAGCVEGGIMTDAVPPMAPRTPSRWGPVGKIRNPWAVIGLSLSTLGIYFFYWTYQVFREMKDHSGYGVGGVIGLVIALVIGVVNWFLIPSEVG